jgi:diguanylate cyclase (GGDEF)-like protein
MNHKLIEEKSILLAQINENLVLEIESREHAQKELELANKQLKAISSLDALTGIPNRRKLDESLKEYWTRVVREKLPIAVMMIDIDFFKIYNDTNGHLAGDQCLQAVAEVINNCRREEDFAARYGGEEFIFIAPGMTKEETLVLGEIIRAEIEALCLEHPFSSASPYVTASIGIHWLTPTSSDLVRETINKADQAMYQAKEAGRNRVKLAQ